MKVLLPPWPKAIARNFLRRADLIQRRRNSVEALDQLALAEAYSRLHNGESVQASGYTGTWAELIWVNAADFTAFNTSSSEGSIISGLNDQPVLQAGFFFNKAGKYRSVTIEAQGVLGTTGTPTIIFQARLGTTSGPTYLSGTSVGVTAAITTSSGVTNKWWYLRLDLTCYTPGIGSGNTTLSGAGYVLSPGGFATPFIYPIEPTTPDTATWTSTLDASLTQYLNLSCTWSASSSSNTITTKSLRMYGWN